MASEKQILVVGYMHSGTTILQMTLSRHSDIYSPQTETVFFDYLPVIQSDYQDINDSEDKIKKYTVFLYECIIAGVPFTALNKNDVRRQGIIPIEIESKIDYSYYVDNIQWFIYLLDLLTAHYEKKYWLEKTPNNLFHFETIIKYLPNAKFVCISRDPRDVIASKKTRMLSVEQKFDATKIEAKKLEKKFSPYIDATSWFATTRVAIKLATKYPKSFMIVKYEDFASNPEKELIQICNFLDITYSDDLLKVQYSNASDIKQKNDGGITTASVGRYGKVLTPSEVHFIQQKLSYVFTYFNYEKQKIGFSDKLLSWLIYVKFPFQLIDRLWARYKLLGPKYFLGFIKLVIKKMTR